MSIQKSILFAGFLAVSFLFSGEITWAACSDPTYAACGSASFLDGNPDVTKDPKGNTCTTTNGTDGLCFTYSDTPTAGACAQSNCKERCGSTETDTGATCPIVMSKSYKCCVATGAAAGCASSESCFLDGDNTTGFTVVPGKTCTPGTTGPGKCYKANQEGETTGSCPTADFQKIAGVCVPTSGATGGLSDKSVVDVLAGFASNLLEIFGVLALIAFLVSGFQYLMAAGDEKEAEIAKKNIKYSVIAVIVALSGVIIINAIETILKAGSVFTS
jgi:hypothetical protein